MNNQHRRPGYLASCTNPSPSLPSSRTPQRLSLGTGVLTADLSMPDPVVWVLGLEHPSCPAGKLSKTCRRLDVFIGTDGSGRVCVDGKRKVCAAG